MLVIFVHGWSVRHTDTYADLPRWLEQKGRAADIPIQAGNIYLGKYISFSDTVTLDDIARAFDRAVKDEAGKRIKKGERFACITHSTGGPVVRKWIDLYLSLTKTLCSRSRMSFPVVRQSRSRRYRGEVQTRRRQSDSSINSSSQRSTSTE
jgi:hypothetical protein